MRRKLRRGGYSTLNIFFQKAVGQPGDGSLGYATFPRSNPTADQIFVRPYSRQVVQSHDYGNLKKTHDSGRWCDFTLVHSTRQHGY